MARANEKTTPTERFDLNRHSWRSNGPMPVRQIVPRTRTQSLGRRLGPLFKRHSTVASATSSTVSCFGQANPATTMLGFRIIPSRSTRCGIKLAENRSQDFLGHLAAPLEGVFAIHQHFRFADWDHPGFLAQCGIPRQCVRVGLDAALLGMPSPTQSPRATWRSARPFDRIP